MAIDFNSEKETRKGPNKMVIFIIILIVVVGIIFFITSKKDTKTSSSASQQMFSPVNIDFEFIESEDFKNLEPFQGIPVLPGFFPASDKEVDVEVIEYGRENPFVSVSVSEVESAVLRAIYKISTEEGVAEMRSKINNFTLYSEDQKTKFNSALDEKMQTIIEAKVEEQEGTEIVLEEEQVIEEILENIEEEQIEEEQIEEEQVEEDSNYKEW